MAVYNTKHQRISQRTLSRREFLNAAGLGLLAISCAPQANVDVPTATIEPTGTLAPTPTDTPIPSPTLTP